MEYYLYFCFLIRYLMNLDNQIDTIINNLNKIKSCLSSLNNDDKHDDLVLDKVCKLVKQNSDINNSIRYDVTRLSKDIYIRTREKNREIVKSHLKVGNIYKNVNNIHFYSDKLIHNNYGDSFKILSIRGNSLTIYFLETKNKYVIKKLDGFYDCLSRSEKTFKKIKRDINLKKLLNV